jgi:histidine ammonia-lyase
LRIEDVLALANRQVPTQLQDDAAYRQRIAKGAQFLDFLLDKEGVIYGVTTGYGDSCVVGAAASRRSLPRHLYTFTVAAWANCSTPRPPAVLAALAVAVPRRVRGARGTAGAPASLPRTRHPAADGRRLGGRQR